MKFACCCISYLLESLVLQRLAKNPGQVLRTGSAGIRRNVAALHRFFDDENDVILTNAELGQTAQKNQSTRATQQLIEKYFSQTPIATFPRPSSFPPRVDHRDFRTPRPPSTRHLAER